jgi:hypothetical protein
MYRSVAWLIAAVSLFAGIRSTSLAQSDHQLPFLSESSASARIRIPGTNNATYGPVPGAEQLFDIEFLELAPFPFKAYARLHIYSTGKTNPPLTSSRVTV